MKTSINALGIMIPAWIDRAAVQADSDSASHLYDWLQSVFDVKAICGDRLSHTGCHEALVYAGYRDACFQSRATATMKEYGAEIIDFIANESAGIIPSGVKRATVLAEASRVDMCSFFISTAVMLWVDIAAEQLEQTGKV